jgi:hypothetical protein
MKVTFLLTTLALTMLMACNNASENNAKQSAAPKTHLDSLMDDIMAGHDVGMGKMGKLSAAQKTAQAAIDSIAKLPATAQKAAAAYKTGLDSLVKELENAKAAMNNWMDGFNMDSAMNDEQKRTEYLEAEKTKIHSVKDQMLKTLDKADSLLRH